MIELHRAVVVDDVIGRTLEGRAVTYGVTYRVSDDHGATYYREGWSIGAFTANINACRNTYELRRRHADHRLGMVTFDDSESHLAFRATIDETEDGDEALAEVETGDLRSVSLGFRPRRHAPADSNGVIWRQKADIRELSLTPVGQYEDAKVLAVRDATGETLAHIRKILVASASVLEYSADI